GPLQLEQGSNGGVQIRQELFVDGKDVSLRGQGPDFCQSFHAGADGRNPPASKGLSRKYNKPAPFLRAWTSAPRAKWDAGGHARKGRAWGNARMPVEVPREKPIF